MWEFELTFSPLGPPEPTGPTAPGSPFWLNEKKYVRILRLTLVHFVLKIYVCATYWPVAIKQLEYNIKSAVSLLSWLIMLWLTRAPSAPALPSGPFSPTEPC